MGVFRELIRAFNGVDDGRVDDAEFVTLAAGIAGTEVIDDRALNLFERAAEDAPGGDFERHRIPIFFVIAVEGFGFGGDVAFDLCTDGQRISPQDVCFARLDSGDSGTGRWEDIFLRIYGPLERCLNALWRKQCIGVDGERETEKRQRISAKTAKGKGLGKLEALKFLKRIFAQVDAYGFGDVLIELKVADEPVFYFGITMLDLLCDIGLADSSEERDCNHPQQKQSRYDLVDGQERHPGRPLQDDQMVEEDFTEEEGEGEKEDDQPAKREIDELDADPCLFK